VLDVRMFETPAGRRPVEDFFDSLPASFRALVLGDEVARQRMKQVR
jgi:hypothetical protein